jgi:hypothetical protein
LTGKIAGGRMHSLVQESINTMRRALNESETESGSPARELLKGMAGVLGIVLSDERAATLETQAEPHFSILNALDTVTTSTSEPAAEFRLDTWTRSSDD